MSSRSEGLPLRSAVRDDLDRWAFIGCVLLGSAGIILLRAGGFNAFLVLAVPIGLILGYAAVVLWTRRLQLREDRAADNCYYMGFVFTLVSLAYALYSFRFAGAVTDQLIQDFGVALGSTIAGVIVRLILNQFRTDPVEIERDARLELAAAAQALRSELQQAVNDFQSFRGSLQQSYAEALDDAKRQASERLAQTAERFEGVAETLVEKVEANAKAHAENAGRLTESAARTVEALEAMMARIENIEAPAHLITEKLQPAVQEIEAAAEAVNKRASADGREAQRLRKAVDAAVSAAELLDQRLQAAQTQETATRSEAHALQQELSALKDAVAAVRASAEESQYIVTGATEALLSSQKTIGSAEEVAQESLTQIRRHNADLDAALGKSRGMVIKVHQELTDLAGAITRRLGPAPESTTDGASSHAAADPQDAPADGTDRGQA